MSHVFYLEGLQTGSRGRNIGSIVDLSGNLEAFCFGTLKDSEVVYIFV